MFDKTIKIYKIEFGNDNTPKETIIVDKDAIDQKEKSKSQNGSVNSINKSGNVANGTLPIAHRQTKRQSVASVGNNESSKKSEDIEMQNIDAVGNCSSKTENERVSYFYLFPCNDVVVCIYFFLVHFENIV